MKKIYLLSAVACLFAFNANAYEDDFIDGWGTDGGKAKIVKTASGTLNITVADASADYNAQLISTSWQKLEGQKQGKSFKLSWEMNFYGEADSATWLIMAGKTFPWSADFDQGGNLQVVDAAGASLGQGYGVRQKKVGKDYKLCTFEGLVGEWGQDSIRIQLNLGGADNDGVFNIKNMKLELDGKVVKEWFTEAAEGTAIAEEAAVKAFVANNVIFASEAADVVVYNINGVAVKSAKNVTSLDVADLKAGLYIAKVGNATVKFVK
jgi:hypothetical protein